MAGKMRGINFFSLPREIRDEIYKLYFSESCLVPYTPEPDNAPLEWSAERFRVYDRAKNETAPIMLLQTSSLVREEALLATYATSTFIFGMQQTLLAETRWPGPPAGRNMMHIEFVFDGHDMSDCQFFHRYAWTFPRAARHFAGTDTQRKNVVVTFRNLEVCQILSVSSLSYVLLYKTLRSLIGSETLTITLGPCPKNLLGWPRAWQRGQNKIGETLMVFWSSLKPALGEGTQRKESENLILTFHPHRHQISRMEQV